jgi:fructosamine-3-kinase
MSLHSVDSKHNEIKLILVPLVIDFVSNHNLFNDKEVNITFAHKGVSSLVSIIETPENKYVLKIPLKENTESYEVLFLNTWRSIGVSTPKVYEEGKIHNFSYVLMEFINAQNLTETYKLKNLVPLRIFVEMGKTLRLMHNSIATGYGQLKNGIPEFTTFDDWINKDEKNVRSINEIKELNLLNDKEHGSILRAKEILIEYVKNDPRSTYCHLDFAPENIFATNPITPFDPNPAFNHPYIDLAVSIVIATSRCGPSDAANQIIEGYFAGEEYNKQVLHAAILRVTYSKFVYWSKTDQPKRLAWLQEYLNTNKYLLD